MFIGRGLESIVKCSRNEDFHLIKKGLHWIVENAGRAVAIGGLSVALSTNYARAVTLAWDPSPDGANITKYGIYAKTITGEPVRFMARTNIVNGECTKTILDENFEQNRAYVFYATAIESDGQESPPSNKVSWVLSSRTISYDDNGKQTNVTVLDDPEDVVPPRISLGKNIISLSDLDTSGNYSSFPKGNPNNPLIFSETLNLSGNAFDESFVMGVKCSGDSINVVTNHVDVESGNFYLTINSTNPGLTTLNLKPMDFVGNVANYSYTACNLNGLTNIYDPTDNVPPNIDLIALNQTLSDVDNSLTNYSPGSLERPLISYDGNVRFWGIINDRNFVRSIDVEGAERTLGNFKTIGGELELGFRLLSPGLNEVSINYSDLAGNFGTNKMYVLNFKGIDNWNQIPNFVPPQDNYPPEITINQDRIALGDYNPALAGFRKGSEANPFCILNDYYEMFHFSGNVEDDGLVKKVELVGNNTNKYLNFDRESGNFSAFVNLNISGTNTFSIVSEDYYNKFTTNSVNVIKIKGLERVEGVMDNQPPSLGIQRYSDYFGYYPGYFSDGTMEKPFMSFDNNYHFGVWANDNFAVRDVRVRKYNQDEQVFFPSFMNDFIHSNILLGDGDVHEVSVAAYDYSGNSVTNNFYVQSANLADSNNNGLTNREEIERGRDPFRPYSEYAHIIINSTNGAREITFSANDSSRYHILYSIDLGKKWIELDSNGVVYTQNGLSGQREGTFVDDRPMDWQGIYAPVSDYDIKKYSFQIGSQ